MSELRAQRMCEICALEKTDRNLTPKKCNM